MNYKYTDVTLHSIGPEETPYWVEAMQASAAPAQDRVPSSWDAVSAREFMGWAVAIFFFIVLATIQLRARRYQKLLLRGGERDFFLLPPAGNRRRRPR